MQNLWRTFSKIPSRPYAFRQLDEATSTGSHALPYHVVFRQQATSTEPLHLFPPLPFAALKRLIDIVGALAGIIIFGLPLLYLMYKIKQDGGPALFKQQRVGQQGKPFWCWKLRSMKMNAEAELQTLLQQNPALANHYKAFRKLPHDPRVTPIGRIIREYSLDELPQLFNVLRGDMSLVGPRPILPTEKAEYGTYIKYYHTVKPGITGLWQTQGRNNLTFQERVALDKHYVLQRSLWLDITILVRTFYVVMLRKGAL